MSHDLIDTTEMYLRTIYELQEEGVVPLRARIAERLGQSNPTVSQTVARMERDGLLVVGGDRQLELTEEGQSLATRVMRKHRLAERLLVDVIGLDWEYVHTEACRWEHVISEAVERRLLELLDHPTESPYGNPIPGLDELGAKPSHDAFLEGVVALSEVELGAATTVVVRRMGEPVQTDSTLLSRLDRAGVRPGAAVQAAPSLQPGQFVLGSAGEETEVSREVASHIFVVRR
ncbi:MAG TPA: metal-dependent transcriptional regulator [Actinomycetes bacterium]|nr:metal-dependent transcriptional regulator [Actinomycetes bacterium]